MSVGSIIFALGKSDDQHVVTPSLQYIYLLAVWHELSDDKKRNDNKKKDESKNLGLK